MSTTMDQIHHIRDMFYQQDKNISEIASETGLNWKTVKKYVDMEDFNSPPPIPASSEIHESKLDPFKPLIDEWLLADKLAPRKQRHTAKRVYKRLFTESGLFIYILPLPHTKLSAFHLYFISFSQRVP